MSRYQLFVGHYKLLREKRKKESIFRTLLSAYPLDNISPQLFGMELYDSYWSNSKTHKQMDNELPNDILQRVFSYEDTR